MSQVVKTFFDESKKVASNAKNSIVPVNMVYHGIIPAIIIAIILLYLCIGFFKISISGQGTQTVCTKWAKNTSSQDSSRCIQYEIKPYNRKWNLLIYLTLIPSLSLILSSMWYKLMFDIYNPYIAAASYSYNSFSRSK